MTDMPLRGMDVVVLAGGLGSRIRHVLGETPKVLAPIHGRPFLAHLLDRLADLGAGRVVLSLGFLADKVRDYLAAHPSPMPVEVVVESEPLGTGGGLRQALPLLVSDPVVVMNGDTWLETDYVAFVAEHHAQGRNITILCVPVEDCGRYGRVEIDTAGGISGFFEKSTTVLGPGLISGGVYLFSRAALQDLSAVPGPSLERDFLQTRAPGSLAGHVARQAVFLDIGTPESLSAANDIIPTDG